MVGLDLYATYPAIWWFGVVGIVVGVVAMGFMLGQLRQSHRKHRELSEEWERKYLERKRRQRP